jgi:hypothetical protein
MEDLLFGTWRALRVLHEGAKSMVVECAAVHDATTSTALGATVVLKLLVDRTRWETEVQARSAAGFGLLWSGSCCAAEARRGVGALWSAQTIFLGMPNAPELSSSRVVYGIALASSRCDLAHSLAHARVREPVELLRCLAAQVRELHRAGYAHCALRAEHVLRVVGADERWTLAGLGSCERVQVGDEFERERCGSDSDEQYKRDGRRRSIRRRRQLFLAPASMSPELWRATHAGRSSGAAAAHVAGPADDVFSLGLIAYALFTNSTALFQTDAKGNFLRRADATRLKRWDGLRADELDLVCAVPREHARSAHSRSGSAERSAALDAEEAQRTRRVVAKGFLAWILAADAGDRPRSIDELLAHALFDPGRVAAPRSTILTVRVVGGAAAAAGAAGAAEDAAAEEALPAEGGGWSVQCASTLRALRCHVQSREARIVVLSGDEVNSAADAAARLPFDVSVRGSRASAVAAHAAAAPRDENERGATNASETKSIEEELRELDTQLLELSTFDAEYATFSADLRTRVGEQIEAIDAAEDNAEDGAAAADGAAADGAGTIAGSAGSAASVAVAVLGEEAGAAPASSLARAHLHVAPEVPHAGDAADDAPSPAECDDDAERSSERSGGSAARARVERVRAIDIAELLQPPNAPFVECVVLLAAGSFALASALSSALRHIAFVAWEDDAHTPRAAAEHFVSELFVALRAEALDGGRRGGGSAERALERAFCCAANAAARETPSAAPPLWLRGGAGEAGRSVRPFSARDLARV